MGERGGGEVLREQRQLAHYSGHARTEGMAAGVVLDVGKACWGGRSEVDERWY